MTPQEQINAVQRFGYSPKEAAFLVQAALHSGYFLRRQACAHRGKGADVLCRKVVAYQHARSTLCGRGTHVFHLCNKPFYAALGQPDNRHRRPQDTCYLRPKVMGLDYVLLHQGYRFLPTEEAKLAYFCTERGLQLNLLPMKVFTGQDGAKTPRYFIDKYPVRIDPQTGRVAFGFIDDGIFTSPSFSAWLQQYTPLLHALGDAEVVHIAATGTAFAAAEQEFAKLFPASTGSLPDELLRYFELRRDIERRGPAGRPQDILDAYRRLSRRYVEARFQQQYAEWNGAPARPNASSSVTLSAFFLPFSYAFLGLGGGGRP